MRAARVFGAAWREKKTAFFFVRGKPSLDGFRAKPTQQQVAFAGSLGPVCFWEGVSPKIQPGTYEVYSRAFMGLPHLQPQKMGVAGFEE